MQYNKTEEYVREIAAKLTPEQRKFVRSQQHGMSDKITTIKAIRNQTSLGLMDSKDVVEWLWNNPASEPRLYKQISIKMDTSDQLSLINFGKALEVLSQAGISYTVETLGFFTD